MPNIQVYSKEKRSNIFLKINSPLYTNSSNLKMYIIIFDTKMFIDYILMYRISKKYILYCLRDVSHQKTWVLLQKFKWNII